MRRALAASLFLAPLVHAAPAAEAVPKTPQQPPLLLRAMTAASQEMQNVVEDGAHLGKTFDALIDFQHSPETARLLREALGDERPWSMEKRAPEKGRAAYRWLLKPVHQTTAGGGTLIWNELPIDLLVDKSGKAVDYRAAWPLLSYEDKDVRTTMEGAAVEGTQRRGGADIWFGDLSGKIDSIRIEGKTSPVAMTMRELTMAGKVLERPRTVDMTQSFGIKAIEVAGERLDDFKMAFRIVNLDKASLVAMRAAAKKKRGAKRLSPEEELNAMMPLLKTFVRGATRHKTAMVFDEISIGFHGYKALLRGRLGLEKVTEADVADMKRLVKNVDARFEVRVPVALVREVALVMARQQAAAAAKAQPLAPPQDAAALAQSITDAMVGKLLGNGYARLENDVLVSTIAFRDGVLRVNGKKIDLPAPAQPSTPAKLSTFMQARRIAESCTLPDYPSEVVTQDAPLALTLQFVVDPEGRLHELQLAQPSNRPDYDQAVLTAFAGCRFIPALDNGKPVRHAMTHTLKREPGSVRP